jgi:hypothetical protein
LHAVVTSSRIPDHDRNLLLWATLLVVNFFLGELGRVDWVGDLFAVLDLATLGCFPFFSALSLV